jgi:hypothetical protein
MNHNETSTPAAGGEENPWRPMVELLASTKFILNSLRKRWGDNPQERPLVRSWGALLRTLGLPQDIVVQLIEL